jgi:nitrite reductase/ring-hydroxylating ferredoxin subunit
MAYFTPIAKAGEIAPGMKKRVKIGEEDVLIVNVEGTFYAVSNLCTHNRLPLSAGRLDGYIIRCTYHGSEFDVRTGEVKTKPAETPLPTYEIKVDGDDILVGGKKTK